MSATLHAKLFLQSLLSRPSLSLPQALAIFSSTALAAHSYDPDLPEPPPKAERDTRWNAFRHELNGQLEPLGMEIRQVLDEGDKGWWVVLVRPCSRPAARAWPEAARRSPRRRTCPRQTQHADLRLWLALLVSPRFAGQHRGRRPGPARDRLHAARARLPQDARASRPPSCPVAPASCLRVAANPAGTDNLASDPRHCLLFARCVLPPARRSAHHLAPPTRSLGPRRFGPGPSRSAPSSSRRLTPTPSRACRPRASPRPCPTTRRRP